MKNKLLLITLIVVLLVSIFPVSVFAAKPQDVDLKVRNRAEVSVQLNLTDVTGNVSFFTIPSGTSSLTLKEGIYTFWASLPCGNVAGQWNVNTVKTLVLDCAASKPAVGLTKAAEVGSGLVVGDCSYIGGDEYGLLLDVDGGGFNGANFLSEAYWVEDYAGYITTWDEVWFWMVTDMANTTWYGGNVIHSVCSALPEGSYLYSNVIDPTAIVNPNTP